jgi:endonuclease YncB( thermonuclease family)
MTRNLLVSLLACALTAVGLVSMPAQAIADRDCGDFPSQRAAQIFFLKHGGPKHDPHRLDEEGDGIACEANPAPYYRKKKLPGGQQQSDGASGRRVKVSRVVDGDTIRLAGGRSVRLIGIDTPERGKPLYGAAKRSLDRMVGARVTLVNPASVQNQDSYGRLLRYVRVSGRDTGLVQIRKGLAHARYDGLDGYDWHPMQKPYRRLDGRTRDRW